MCANTCIIGHTHLCAGCRWPAWVNDRVTQCSQQMRVALGRQSAKECRHDDTFQTLEGLHTRIGFITLACRGFHSEPCNL
jgi:hypothetical protein